MPWHPIVVGVDASPEAAAAAALGLDIAQAAQTTCQLVHAVPDAWTTTPGAAPEDVREITRSLLSHARHAVRRRLWCAVPPETAEALVVEPGKAAVVLRQAATRLDAELIVVGGKHHGFVERWVHGSTAQALVRTTRVPVLVATAPVLPHRVLVAVDQSVAARSTLRAAERFAACWGAELRALSVIEPIPVIPEMLLPFGLDQYYDQACAELERGAWAQLGRSVHKQVRRGGAVEVIVRDVHDWPADLLVLGSHGRGWVERALVGSVTERLLSHLPTAVLVIPAYTSLIAERDRAPAAHADGTLAPV